MKVEIIQRETIKPSSPTPPNLKIHKVSLLDQVVAANYNPIILFYPANGEGFGQKSQVLKRSLSEALTQYYPLAGRIKDHLSIDCNDQGAEFVGAQIHCCLSDLLEKPDIRQFQQLIPANFTTDVTTASSLILVQVNYFQCGGVAIALCLSHKIADGTTYFTFIKNWASLARGAAQDEDVSSLPDLTIASSIFPPQDSQPSAFKFPDPSPQVGRRFIFTPASITALKTKSAVENPTRAEVVAALIWRAIINTMGLRRREEGGLYVCAQSVDIRTRFSPALSNTAVGNLLVPLMTIAREKEGTDLRSLVLKLRIKAQEFKVERGKIIIAELNQEMMSLIRKENAHSFFLTNCCEMPAYEGDFGWGKPVWFTIVIPFMFNSVRISNTSDGEGIEAIVNLTEEEMAVFERDQELLEFATISPSILFQS